MFDFVYAINLTHIAPWAASLGLLDIAGGPAARNAVPVNWIAVRQNN